MAPNRKQADADAERVALEYLAGIRSLEPEKPPTRLLRRRQDEVYNPTAGRFGTIRPAYDGLSIDGDKRSGGVLSSEAAEDYNKTRGYKVVGDEEFETAKHGGPVKAPKGSTPFIRGDATHASKAPAFTGAEMDYRAGPAKPGPATWAEDDFRAGAAAMYPDGQPALEQDWVDAPKSPMSPAGRKAAGARSSIAVGMPAADRAAAGRIAAAPAAPAAAQRALQASGSPADVARAADPYGDARAAASRNRLGTQLARAGGMVNQALSGARLDDGAYDELEAQSEQPVADFAARREMGRQDATDAGALEERRLRAEDYARRAASGERDFKYQQERDVAGDKFRASSAAEEARRFDAQQRSAAADRALRRSEAGDRRTDAEDARNERARIAREAAQQQQSDKALQTLGQQTSKLPIGELQQALESIDAQAPGLAYGKAPKELPMGTWDAMARSVPYGAGEWAMSDDGKQYAATIAQLRDIVMRMRSGAAINKSEERHYLSLLGDNVLSNPQKAADGINTVREGLAQRLNNIQAPYVRGGTLDEYERQGGSSFRAPIFSGSQTQNTVEAKPTGRTVTMPDGRVYDVLDNGKARPRG